MLARTGSNERVALSSKRDAAAAKRDEHAQTARQLRLVEAFIVEARTALLSSSLAHLEAAASVWLPGLSLRVDGDGLRERATNVDAHAQSHV